MIDGCEDMVISSKQMQVKHKSNSFYPFKQHEENVNIRELACQKKVPKPTKSVSDILAKSPNRPPSGFFGHQVLQGAALKSQVPHR